MSLRSLAVAALLASGLRLAAAPVPPPGPADPTRAVITGVVVDEAGKPAADVSVRTLWRGVGGAPASAHTDAAGRFRLVLDRATNFYDLVLASATDGVRL